MQLHTLNRSPLVSNVWRQALTAMSGDDRLLLIEDGVQGALAPQVGRFADIRGRLFALREDLEARGLLERCAEGIQIIDVDGFVDLTAEADKVIGWY